MASGVEDMIAVLDEIKSEVKSFLCEHCRHNNNALANFIRVFLWYFSDSDAIYLMCVSDFLSVPRFSCVGFACV